MKRLAIVAAAVVILLAGGGLTAQILIGGSRSLFLTQSLDPDASVMAVASWQAEQLVLFIGFILFNLIGMGATIALVMWVLHRGVKEVQVKE